MMDDNFFRQARFHFFRIDRIVLENFRCFSAFDLELNRKERKVNCRDEELAVAPLTVIVAPNGIGKTSILDAIRIVFASFISSFGYKNKVKINEKDIRIQENLLSLPVIIDAVGELGYSWYEWECRIPKGSKQFSQTVGGVKNIVGNPFKNFLKSLNHDAINSHEISWPLLASYGTNRLWKKSNNYAKRNLIKDRDLGYESCLEAASNYATAFGWMFDAVMSKINEQTIEIIQDDVLRIQLSTVEKALATILEPEGYIASLHFDPYFKELAIIQMRDSEKVSIPVSSLSDGVRAVFFMVADIAFRCVKLNPHLRALAAQETEGIVMIDEIELHLHPSWQQKILDTLQIIFPKIQFIVTTHSPQVVSSVPSECVRIIDQGKVFYAVGTEGAEASRVLKRIFGTEAFPENNPQRIKLNKYLDLVYAGNWETNEALQLRDELNNIYRGEEPLLGQVDLFIENEKWERDHDA